MATGLLAACGGNDGSTTGGPATPSPDPTPIDSPTIETPAAPTPNEGCSARYPTRIEATGGRAGLVLFCADATGRGASFTNRSRGFVFRVTTADGAAPASFAVRAPSSQAYADRAVQGVVPNLCLLPSRGPCRLVPGATATISSPGAVRVVYDVDPQSTTAATLANGAASFLPSRSSPGVAKLQAIIACAKASQRFVTPDQYVSDSIRDAFAASISCRSTAHDIAKALGRDTPEAATAADETLRFAGRFAGNAQKDLALFEAVELATHLH